MQNKMYFWLWLLGVNLNLLHSQGISIWSSSGYPLPSSSILLSDAIRVPEGVEYIDEWGIHEEDWVQQAGEDTLATVLRLSANLIETGRISFNSIESKTNGASLSISQAFDEQGKLLGYGYSMCDLHGKEQISSGFSLSESGFGMGTGSHSPKTRLFMLNLRDRQGRIKRRLFFSTDRYKYTRTNKLILQSQRKQGLKIVRRWVARRWFKDKIHYEEMDKTPKTVRQILRKKFLLTPDTLLKLETKIAEEEDKGDFLDRKRLNALMASHPVRNQPILSPFQQVYSYRGDTTIEWTIMAHPKSWDRYWSLTEPVVPPKRIKRLPKTVKFNGRRQRLRVKSERDLVWVLLRERKIDAKGQIQQDLFFNKNLRVDYFVWPIFNWIDGEYEIVWTYDERGWLVRQDFKVSEEKRRFLDGRKLGKSPADICPSFGYCGYMPQAVTYRYPVIDERGNWLLRIADGGDYPYTIRTIRYRNQP